MLKKSRVCQLVREPDYYYYYNNYVLNVRTRPRRKIQSKCHPFSLPACYCCCLDNWPLGSNRLTNWKRITHTLHTTKWHTCDIIYRIIHRHELVVLPVLESTLAYYNSSSRRIESLIEGSRVYPREPRASVQNIIIQGRKRREIKYNISHIGQYDM